MKVILVPVADRPECINALHVAFELARKLGASVCGCHIRAHRNSEVALRSDSSSSELSSSADLNAESEASWGGTVDDTVSTSAEGLFSKIAEQQNYPVIKKPKAKPGAMWQEKVGSPEKVLSIMGPVSDLIILSRPTKKGGKLARLFMLTALLNSSRPVLVLPQSSTSSIGKRISIAWNQSPEATQAVAAAMPLLRLADQVTIITCGPEGGAGPKSAQLVSYLSFWGVKAKRVKSEGRDDAKAILKAYQDTDSDLLVMGAYSRSRLRQSIFGGVTEFMLYQANIPILMLHS